jgi:hypothetical protein
MCLASAPNIRAALERCQQYSAWDTATGQVRYDAAFVIFPTFPLLLFVKYSVCTCTQQSCCLGLLTQQISGWALAAGQARHALCTLCWRCFVVLAPPWCRQRLQLALSMTVPGAVFRQHGCAAATVVVLAPGRTVAGMRLLLVSTPCMWLFASHPHAAV